MTRRDFLKLTGLTGGVTAVATPWARVAPAQGLKAITASHSVSTFVYGQHLVAAQKKFFEEEGVRTPDFVVPGGGASGCDWTEPGGGTPCPGSGRLGVGNRRPCGSAGTSSSSSDGADC